MFFVSGGGFGEVDGSGGSADSHGGMFGDLSGDLSGDHSGDIPGVAVVPVVCSCASGIGSALFGFSACRVGGMIVANGGSATVVHLRRNLRFRRLTLPEPSALT